MHTREYPFVYRIVGAQIRRPRALPELTALARSCYDCYISPTACNTTALSHAFTLIHISRKVASLLGPATCCRMPCTPAAPQVSGSGGFVDPLQRSECSGSQGCHAPGPPLALMTVFSLTVKVPELLLKMTRAKKLKQPRQKRRQNGCSA